MRGSFHMGLRPSGALAQYSPIFLRMPRSARIDVWPRKGRESPGLRAGARGLRGGSPCPPGSRSSGASAQDSTRRLTDIRRLPATPPQAFDDERGCSLTEESRWEGYSEVSESSPTGDQAEAEDGFTARNDASNRVVANSLRADSAGSAGSASAALGGFT